jgi:hypothetical protein
MCFKKRAHPALPGLVASLALLLFRPAYAQVVDCILAEVNNRIVTLVDVQVLSAFSPGSGDAGKISPVPLRQVLEEAINRKVVLDLVQESIAPTEEEVAALLRTWKEGTDPAEWQRKLNRFGFAEADLAPYLEELILFDKLIGLRFSPGFDVNLQEIETYYKETYVPAERGANREPKPMVQILDELEARLKREKTSQQVAQWIQNVRAQAEVRLNSLCLEQLR